MSNPSLPYTPIDEIENIRARLREGFYSGKFKSIEYRKYQLLQLAYLIKDNVKQFEEALAHDLGRPVIESDFLEIGATLSEIKTCLSSVESWAKTERTPFSANFVPMRPVIRKEPKGVVAIIGPFNYPIWCTIGPLAGAIAAGNAVVMKPSEQTIAVSSLLSELANKYLDNDLVQFVNGAIPETTKLLELQWDHILYTGSERVGRVVAAAAAKHTTPVTLELGGKSPVIIDPTCDLPTAAKRILWGKAVNAGQTCVAPDYVLVPKDFQDNFVNALKAAYDEFYPEKPSAKSFSHLISNAAYDRISKSIASTAGSIVLGGLDSAEEQNKFIPPTVVKDVKGDDPLMKEEIFGPVLPLVPVESLDKAIDFINERPHPLALYVFSRDEQFKTKVLENTESGSAVMNEVLIQPGVHGMPFGGTGSSGYGYHTGKYSFDMFTHLRGSMDSPSWIDKVLLSMRFPPYTKKKEDKVASFSIPSLPARPLGPPHIRPNKNGTSKRWGKWFLFLLTLGVFRLLNSSNVKIPIIDNLLRIARLK